MDTCAIRLVQLYVESINKWVQNGTFGKTHWLFWISHVCMHIYSLVQCHHKLLGGKNWECKIMVRHWGREKRLKEKKSIENTKKKKSKPLARHLCYIFIYLFISCDSAFVARSVAPKPCCAAPEWPSPPHSRGDILQAAASLLQPPSFFSKKTSVVAGEWKQTSLLPFLAALRTRDSSVLLWFYFILSLLLWWLYIWFVYFSTIPYCGLAAAVLYYKETSLYSTM